MDEDKVKRVDKIIKRFSSNEVSRIEFSDDLDVEFPNQYAYNIVRPLMDDMPIKDREYIFPDYAERFAKCLMLILEP